MTKEQLGVLILDCERQLYSTAKTILYSDQDCADAIQDTIVKAFSKIQTLKNDKYARTWLIRILINECYTILRKSSKLTSLDMMDEQTKAEKIMMTKEKADYSELYQAINELKEELRLPVILYYIEDFNIRETAGEAFLSFEQLNNEAMFDIDLLKPRYGIGGVDLSSTTDLTNATLIFKTRDNLAILYVEQMYWIPEDLFEKRVQEDNIPYDIWYERGFIRKCSGNRINYHDVVEWFIEMQQKHDIYLYKCGYDSWSAAYFVEDMKKQFGEMTMEAVIQGKKTLSAPMKNLEAELTAKRIIYNNNPVLKWCMGNVSVDIDKNNNIQPCKTSRTLRIDGFAGLLDAFVVLERNLEDYLNLC